MPIPDVQTVVKDPEFQALPWGERHKVMAQIDRDYAALPRGEQAKALNGLKKMPFWNPSAKAAQKPSAPKPASKSAWQRFKEQVKGDIAEPFKLASEAVAGTLNLPVKVAKGYMGLASAGNALLHGSNLDQSLQTGANAIGNRNAITSPLPPSRTSQFIGNHMVQPAVNALTRATGQPELVEGGIEAAGDVAALMGMEPIGKAAVGTAKNALKKVAMTETPEKLYGSAVKMPLSRTWTKQLGTDGMTKRKAAISAGLEGEVPVSEAGIAKAKSLEESHRNAVDSVIKQLDANGTLIPKNTLRQGLDAAYKTANVEGEASTVRLVDRLYDNRFNKMGKMVKVGERTVPDGVSGGTIKVPVMERQYTPSEVQTIKRHLYKMENYEKQKLSRGLGSQLKELGNKGMAHEAKVALEKLYPELKGLNKKDASYIALIEGLEKAVPRIGNRDVVGLGAKVLLTGTHPWTAILEHTLGLPSFKAKLAFALNRARKIQKQPVAANAAKGIAAGTMKTSTMKPQEGTDEPETSDQTPE